MLIFLFLILIPISIALYFFIHDLKLYNEKNGSKYEYYKSNQKKYYGN